MQQIFFSRAKLLLTGEYVVLQGAKCLAFPLKVRQSLSVKPNNSNKISWVTTELDKQNFSAEFKFGDFEIIKSSNDLKASYLSKILKAAKKLNTGFLKNSKGLNIAANIEFNMDWGLGTSSTLLNNIAQFAKINAFDLNKKVSKGSGYDIACASASTPITYQLVDASPVINPIKFQPEFIDNLTLVYLNRKEATENNINCFLDQNKAQFNHVKKISEITDKIINTDNLNEFMELFRAHEDIISNILGRPSVKKILFPEFKGVIKSLGAWGGDFILAASHMSYKKQKDFFNNNGYKTVIPFKELII